MNNMKIKRQRNKIKELQHLTSRSSKEWVLLENAKMTTKQKKDIPELNTDLNLQPRRAH